MAGLLRKLLNQGALGFDQHSTACRCGPRYAERPCLVRQTDNGSKSAQQICHGGRQQRHEAPAPEPCNLIGMSRKMESPIETLQDDASIQDQDDPLDEHDHRYIIAIDYGTTFTGVAWILTTSNRVGLSDIRAVDIWPGGIGDKVPSEYTYSANSGQSWGYGIGNNAYVIRWTKLELEKPARLDALLALSRTIGEAGQLNFGPQNVVRSEIPRHLIRNASNIVTDYLYEVALVARRDIESLKDPQTLSQFPIDFVITHPAEWDERARNLTFRAVNEAFGRVFFGANARQGSIRMATEPEACAQYTMRAARDEGFQNLRKGECFIVVDAGGGTVDLVSYIVEEEAPKFKVKKITKVSGAPCGATDIDKYFLKTFLPSRLSRHDYSALMAMGGRTEMHGQGSHVVLKRGEQIMLSRFMGVKHSFAGQPAHGQSGDNFIELPDGIGLVDDPANNIRDGQLIITAHDLEDMFRESVEGTLRLINQQVVQIDRKHLHVRTIFLSGGFSRSEYLKKRVQELARSWRLTLLRGEDSWTAVVKGAVLMGLGKVCDAPPAVSECPYHVGVVVASRFAPYDHVESQKYVDTFDNITRAKDNIKWIIEKGDLIAHNSAIDKSEKIVRKTNPNGNKTGRVIIVVSEWNTYGSPPTQLLNAEDSSRRLINLDYDLSTIPAQEFRDVIASASTPRGSPYHRVEMQLEITVNQTTIQAELVCGKVVDMFGVTAKPGYRLATYNWRMEDTP